MQTKYKCLVDWGEMKAGDIFDGSEYAGTARELEALVAEGTLELVEETTA